MIAFPSPFRASAGYPLRLALALLVGLTALGCTQAAEPTEPVATSQVDLPRSYRFAPADIAIETGTTVTWTNNDSFTHSVRFADGGEVLMMKPGEQVTHTFDSAGLFRYDCSLHPNDMQGTVRVEAGSD
jgi:plastocyanin